MLIDSPPHPETTEVVHTPESSANVDSNLLTETQTDKEPHQKTTNRQLQQLGFQPFNSFESAKSSKKL